MMVGKHTHYSPLQMLAYGRNEHCTVHAFLGKGNQIILQEIIGKEGNFARDLNKN